MAQTAPVNPWRWQDALQYSQGIDVRQASRVLYCAGQASVNAEGAPVHQGDMRAQLEQAVSNLETVLTQAGLSLGHVVRLNYYTTDVDAFLGAMPAIAGRLRNAGCKPASTLLGVTRLAYPDLLIEIEATAVA
jgi:enamine deaminase RidA (YjgF/YER057c/UK114 family)